MKDKIEGIREIPVTEEYRELLEEEIVYIENEVSKQEIYLLLDGEYDDKDCVLEIHSGAGGTEACDWASMLYRMYTRWLEKNKYKYIILDYQEGEEVGIKSVSLEVKGLYAYGRLKCEKGIHRLVRLSPFDSNNKRHTSFASIEVTPTLEEAKEVKIADEDLKIDVYRSGGAGGQSVNTTDSAVRITHLPTKIVVVCQNERSQLQNKEQAMAVLRNKLLLLEIEKNNNKINELKGEKDNINFGSQIRSYVLQPYTMVKDHRTEYQTPDFSSVLDGDLDDFIKEKLKYDKNNRR